MAAYSLGVAVGEIRIRTGEAVSAYGKVRAQHAATMSTLERTAMTTKRIGLAFGTVGAAAVAGFYLAAKASAELEKRLSFLQAVTTATPAQMDRVRQSVFSLAKQFGVMPNEIADAYNELAKAGVTVPQIVEKGWGQATLTLARAAEVTASSAAEMVISVQNSYGKAAGTAQHTADILAGVANASSIDIADVAVSMKYVGATAHAMGISLESTGAALGVLAQNGIRGSTAGTSLRRMLIQLTGPTDTAHAELEKLGIVTKDGANAFFDASGKARSFAMISQILQAATKKLSVEQKVQALNTIFGARAMASAVILSHAGAKGLDLMAKAASRTTALDIARKRMDNLAGSVDKMRAALDVAFIQMGAPAQGPLKALVDMITKVINGFSNLNPAAQKTIVVFTLVVGVLFTLGGAFMLAISFGIRLWETFILLKDAMVVFKTIQIGTSIVTLFTAGLQAAILYAKGFAAALATIEAEEVAATLGLALIAIALAGIVMDFIHGDKAIVDFKKSLKEPVQDNFLKDMEMQLGDLQDSVDGRMDHLKGSLTDFDNYTQSLGDWLTHPLRTWHDETGKTQQEIDELKMKSAQAYGNLHDLTMVLGNVKHGFVMAGDENQMLKVLNAMGMTAEDLATTPLPELIARVHEFQMEANSSKDPAERAAQALIDMGNAANTAEQDVTDLKNALDLLAGKALSTDQAAISFRNDLVDLDKKLKAAAGSMSLNSQKGRDAREAFDVAAESAISLSTSVKDTTGSTDKARASLTASIAKLKEHAGSSDYAKGAIKRMQEALDALGEDAPKQGKKASDAAKGVAAAFGAAAHTAFVQGQLVGHNLGSGLIAGLNDMMPHADVTGKLLVSQTAKQMRLAADPGSPSKLTRKIGVIMGQGLWAGMEDEYPRVKRSLQWLTKQIPQWKGPRRIDLRLLFQSGKAIMDGLVRGLKHGVPGVKSQLDIITRRIEYYMNRARALKDTRGLAILTNLKKRVNAYGDHLIQVAKKRDALINKIARQKDRLDRLLDLRADFAKSIREQYRALGNLETVVSATDASGNAFVTSDTIVSGLQQRLAAIKQFHQNLNKLRKMGLSKHEYFELLQAGPEAAGPYVNALVAGGAGAVKQVNALESQIKAEATKMGTESSNLMYKQGINTVKGYIKGLESRTGHLRKVMMRIAREMVRALKNALGIHSPARALMWPGQMTSAGFAEGMLQGRRRVLRAAHAVGKAAIPPQSAMNAHAAGISPSSLRVSRTAPYAPKGDVNVTQYIRSTEPRKASDESARKMRTLAAMGAFE